MITIKNRYTGKIIIEAQTMSEANLSGADLSEANLRTDHAPKGITFLWINYDKLEPRRST